MISKELLNAVLNSDYEKVDNETMQIDTCHTIIHATKSCGCCSDSLNIHELAHKCKVWLVGTLIEKAKNENKKRWDYAPVNVRYDFIADRWECHISYHNFFAKTEPEAIFAAAQWILEQKAK